MIDALTHIPFSITLAVVLIGVAVILAAGGWAAEEDEPERVEAWDWPERQKET